MHELTRNELLLRTTRCSMSLTIVRPHLQVHQSLTGKDLIGALLGAVRGRLNACTPPPS